MFSSYTIFLEFINNAFYFIYQAFIPFSSSM